LGADREAVWEEVFEVPPEVVVCVLGDALEDVSDLGCNRFLCEVGLVFSVGDLGVEAVQEGRECLKKLQITNLALVACLLDQLSHFVFLHLLENEDEFPRFKLALRVRIER